MSDWHSQQCMWESLRADARHQDTEVEALLNQLESVAQHAASTSSAPSGVGVGASSSSQAAPVAAMSPQTLHRFDAASEEAAKGIRKLQALVASMKDVLRAASAGGVHDGELSHMHQFTARFDDLVAEKQQVIRHITREFARRREKAELMGKVHTTIAIHRESEEMRHIAGERESLMHSRKKVAGLLDTAQANRERLALQRQRFMAVADNLVTIMERVPFIHNLLKKIDAKRRRDVIVLGMVIAICLIITIVFLK